MSTPEGIGATRLSDGSDGFVTLRMSKGVILILPLSEYLHALKRGKMVRRTQRRLRHQQQIQAQQEASRLAWIAEY